MNKKERFEFAGQYLITNDVQFADISKGSAKKLLAEYICQLYSVPSEKLQQIMLTIAIKTNSELRFTKNGITINI